MSEAFVFGERMAEPPLTTSGIETLGRTARDRARGLGGRDVATVARRLAALQPLWARGGRWRAAFLESRPEEPLALSLPMIEWGLDRFAASLDADTALARVAAQLGSAPDAGCVERRAEPLGVVLHVVSGSVFFGPAESLLAGLLTRNVGIAKQPTGAGAFLELFCRSLAEAAPELAECVALLAWPGGRESVERALAEQVDGIVVAGGLPTIAAYRRLAPAGCALVEFGPRASVAVVSRAGLEALEIDRLAADVALWDQLACTAAQCVYVESGTNGALEALAARLAAALEALATSLPEGRAGIDERIEVARFRDAARLSRALGAGSVRAGAGLSTVVVEADAAFRPSPLRRCVRLKPYRDLDGLVRALEPARGLLQTAGLAVAPHERDAYARRLAAAGARRLCPVGRMNAPPPAGLRDGIMELQRLVRWVEADA